MIRTPPVPMRTADLDFGGNSGGGGNKFRCSGLAHDPHGKLGLRTGQSQRRDVCM
jgi:hypothetical protein